MAQLANIRHERFARELAKGRTISAAYVRAGYSPNKANACRLLRHKRKTSEKIQNRVRELLEMADRELPKSAEDILGMVNLTYELATESGQHSAALKACEMLGKQMFSMFTDRRETINLDLSRMPKADLETYLRERYGDKAQGLIQWLEGHYFGSQGMSDNSASPGCNVVRETTRPAKPVLTLVPSDGDE